MAQQTKKAAPAKAAPKPAEQPEQESRPAVIPLVARVQKLFDNPDSKVKAIVGVNIGGEYAIHGIKVIDSEKGRFVSMPNDKWTDSEGKIKYTDTFHAVSKEARDKLIGTVMAAYEQKLAEVQSQSNAPAEETEAADDELPNPARKCNFLRYFSKAVA